MKKLHLVAFGIAALSLNVLPHRALADEALEHLKFAEFKEMNCVTKGGTQKALVNEDKTRSIEAYVDRYFAGVRQAGRSIIVLAPNGGTQKLGCSRVLDDEQRWEIVKAIFVNKN